MNDDVIFDPYESLEPFINDGWLREILYEVKSGKEATVFCCRGGDRSPVPLVAAKVYRPIETRRFKNDGAYTGGRVHLVREGRFARAVAAKSAFGRAVQYGTWIAEEWEVLGVLHDCGVTVPRPVVVGERAILMEFLGDETAAAPMLHAADVDSRTAARYVDDLLGAVEHMLHLDCVHGDLSPYNVMVAGDRPVIIDFPQAIDPRLNRNGRAMLERDVERLCDWAGRHGVRRPAARIAARLWSRFVSGEIG